MTVSILAMMQAWGGHWLGVLIAAVLGSAVGSFANVVVYRSPRDGMSSLRPARSFCPSCRSGIAWFDNVPILSWIVLRGRCRSCRARISFRYPAVEVVMAALFAAAWWHAPPTGPDAAARLLVVWYLATASVIVTLVDLEHLIIPDAVTIPGIVIGLLASMTFPELHAGHPGFRDASPHLSALSAALLGIAAGGGSLYVVGRIGNVFLRKRLDQAGVEDSMGFGDVKWMAMAGAFLGAAWVLDAIMLACICGAVVGLVLIVIARISRQAAPVGIPFGPYLSAGLLVELAKPGAAWDLLSELSGVA